MKTVRYRLVFLFFGLTSLARAQVLDDLLTRAAENSPALRAKYAEFEAALQRVAQAHALPDPTISFGYFISPVETRVGPQRARLSLNQMFPWFGTLAAKKDMSTDEAQARYLDFVNARNELAYKVKAAWYPLYEVRRIRSLQQENRDILSSLKQLATASFRNGKGGMTDVIRVDIMLDMADTEIRLLEDKESPLLTRLRTLVNLPAGFAVDLPDSMDVPGDEVTISSDSLSANPALAAFDARIRSAESRAVAARRNGLPRFGVGIDYVIVDGRSDMVVPDNGKDVVMPMLSVSLPLYRGNYRSAYKEARFSQAALTAAREDYANELASQYETARFEMNRARQMAALYRSQITKTNQALDLLLSRYANSGNDFEEVLRMQQDVLKYRMAAATAVKDYHTALARLEYLTAKTE